ncbi:C40 family peptidase [Actinokineospora sp. 24-640]
MPAKRPVRTAVLAVLMAAPVVLAGPAQARADDPPTTVAGLLLHYQELSERAEQANERSMALTERIAANREVLRALDRGIAELTERLGTVAPTPEAAPLLARREGLHLRAAGIGTVTGHMLTEQGAVTAELDTRIVEVKSVLAALPPEQRALLNANAPAVPPAPPPPVGPAPAPDLVPAPAPAPAAGTSAVVDFALAQLGKPYEWGAEGPHSFDCSGLVQAAFATVGIAVPRVSIDQSRVGGRVDRADVRPGDLVFYYQPVHHVAIALDRDRVVHAATFGEPVKIGSLDGAGPVTVIRRVVG